MTLPFLVHLCAQDLKKKVYFLVKKKSSLETEEDVPVAYAPYLGLYECRDAAVRLQTMGLLQVKEMRSQEKRLT